MRRRRRKRPGRAGANRAGEQSQVISSKQVESTANCSPPQAKPTGWAGFADDQARDEWLASPSSWTGEMNAKDQVR